MAVSGSNGFLATRDGDDRAASAELHEGREDSAPCAAVTQNVIAGKGGGARTAPRAAIPAYDYFLFIVTILGLDDQRAPFPMMGSMIHPMSPPKMMFPNKHQGFSDQFRVPVPEW
jgi:hypothetical protein